MTFTTTARAISLLVGVGIALASAPGLRADEEVARLTEFLSQRHSEHGFSGSVLVASGDDVVLERSYGYANHEHSVAFTADTLFRIGSVTKPFVAAAVLLLEADGKISTDDRLCQYLSPCPEPWSTVEIRHLLGHTSGIPDLFGDVEEAPIEETVQAIYEAIAANDDLALASDPGEIYAYSNFGYMLLGAVIEAVTEGYLGDAFRQRIFEPLGMDHTRWDRVWEIVEGRARGYSLDEGVLVNTEYEDPCAWAAGGLLSTPRDLVRFVRAIASGDLLGPETTRRALTPGAGGYGLGWAIGEQFDRKVVWHNGGIGGFGSQLLYYPEEDLTVVALSNVENANADGVACTSAGLVFGEQPMLAGGGESYEPAPTELAGFAGRYTSDSGERSIDFEDGTLLYRGRIRLLPIGAGTFRFERPDHYRLTFDVGSTGTASGFIIDACGAELLRAERGADVGQRLPLNLDYSRPGLVDPESPWSWWIQPMRWAGVEVKATPDELRFVRSEAGATAQAVYDLNAELGGRRLELAASAQAAEGSDARLRVGLLALDEDWEAVEAWSRPVSNGDLATALEVPHGARNAQVLVEYEGTGEISLSPLHLSVDGSLLQAEAPGQIPPPPSDYTWVESHALPIRTTDPRAPADDLAGLKPMIGDARFVLLGESTHGSREFFTLKDRVVRWLMEDEGFTVFALEDHVGAVQAVDRYVQTGVGSPEVAMQGLFGFWRRQSMRDLVDWMRHSVHSGRIGASFIGIDMQVPTGALSELDAFASTHDPSLAEAIEASIGPMRRAWEETRYPRRSTEEHESWVSGAHELITRLEERTPRYRENLGDAPTDWVLFNARLVLQSAEVSASDDIRVRDRFLAENLSWLSERLPPKARIVVWAHNTHVRLDESAMGQHLRELHPGEVISIGLFTQEGNYVAWDGSAMREYSLFPGPTGSIEELLHRTGYPVLALDLQPARSAPGHPLAEPLLHRNIGLFPADLGFYRARLVEGFDAVLFVDRTTSTRPLPSR